MRDVVIDTDAASLLQKQQAPPWVLRHVDGARVWLTFVTMGELAKWTVVRRWGEDRRRRLDDWAADRPVIPYDTQIARVWGALAGAAQLRGRPRPQNDTWIAACCLRYHIPLVTLNTADFSDFTRTAWCCSATRSSPCRSLMATAESALMLSIAVPLSAALRLPGSAHRRVGGKSVRGR